MLVVDGFGWGAALQLVCRKAAPLLDRYLRCVTRVTPMQGSHERGRKPNSVSACRKIARSERSLWIWLSEFSYVVWSQLTGCLLKHGEGLLREAPPSALAQLLEQGDHHAIVLQHIYSCCSHAVLHAWATLACHLLVPDSGTNRLQWSSPSPHCSVERYLSLPDASPGTPLHGAARANLSACFESPLPSEQSCGVVDSLLERFPKSKGAVHTPAAVFAAVEFER